jgi:SNF2 family DNA or RNA helicase
MIMSYQILKGDMETLSVLDNTVHLDFCILDEAHMVKSPLSGIGKSIHKLPFKIKWALTATPTPNNPLEWYNYFKWFGLIKTNWHKFNMVHTVRNGYIIWYYRNMDDIQAYCRNFMLKRTKAEKLKELPPMDIREYIIPMSKAHRDVYNTVSQEILEELEELENCTMATQLTKLLRLRQITDHPKMVGSDVASSKLIYLKQLVDDFVSEGRKVVVYSVFQEMVSLMAQELSEYNPAVITGLTQKHGRTKESAERAVKKDHPDAVGMVYDKLLHEYMSSPSQKEVNKFQQDDTCKVFLGTAGACREGLTLTAGTVVISTSSEWSEDYNDQAFSRLHRIGQLETVQVIYLLLEDSVDMYVRQVAIDKTIINKNFTGVHPLIQNILGGRGKVKAPKKENSRKKGL